ncbi:sugar ABC transporter permease [Candidatus Amarolinea aalborgensis]|uniref:sugar ABC transporter permease n=1 Tax=Candidatus Amarolinea aalborgensis TaxID=2249329 RepID=UPI003BFA1BD0
MPYRSQLIRQLILLFITFITLFPIVWIVSLSIDPSGLARPTELRLIPAGASLDAYRRVMAQPTNNPITFAQLAWNSFMLATGVAFFSVGIGVSAAYVFSRFKIRGQRFLMLAVLTVLMMPSIGSIAPLFVLLNKIRIGVGPADTLRNSLYGVGLAIISGGLPFAIWNLKGYLDTIPRDLEEAARIDGATINQTFLRIILPLATPALAVTAFLGFLSGWTEFALSWQFLNKVQNFTLSMALWNMTGQYAGQVPWSNFAAMALLVATPVSVVYLMLQKYIVSGLTIGSVK